MRRYRRSTILAVVAAIALVGPFLITSTAALGDNPLVIPSPPDDPVMDAMKLKRAQVLAEETAALPVPDPAAAARRQQRLAAQAATHVLSATDDGKTIDLTMNDTKFLTINLEEKQAAGLSWTVAKTDGKSLVQNGKVVYNGGGGAQAGGSLLVISPGKYVANFDVKEPGKTTITMEYRDAGAANAPAIRTFTVIVNVAAAATQPTTKP